MGLLISRTGATGSTGSPTVDTLETISPGLNYLISHFVVNNTTGATITFKLGVIPGGGGGAPAANDWIIENVPVDDDDPFIGGGFLLRGGDDLIFEASVAGVHIHLYGETVK